MTWTLWTALYQALSGWVRRPNQALPLDLSGAPAAGSLGAAPELRSGGHETGIDGEIDGVRTYMGVHPIELGLYRDKEERETGGAAVTASSVPRVERLGEVASKEPRHSSALPMEKRFCGTAHLNGKHDRDNQTFFDSRPGLTLTRTALASGIVARVQHTTTATRSKPADRSRGAYRSDSEPPLWSRKKQSTTEYERLVRRLSRLESKLPPTAQHAGEEAARAGSATTPLSTEWHRRAGKSAPGYDASCDAAAADAEASLVRLRASALLQELHLEQVRRAQPETNIASKDKSDSVPSPAVAIEPPTVEVIELSDDEDDDSNHSDWIATTTTTTTPAGPEGTSKPAGSRSPVGPKNLVAGPVRAQVVEELSAATDRHGPLSELAHNLLRVAWDNELDSRQILVSRSRFRLSRNDLLCLRPGGWLTDAILNAYCQHLLTERQQREGRHRRWPHCYIFSTYFYTRLISGGRDHEAYDYAGVRRWTRDVDIFTFDRILVPINLSNTHWTLVMIEPLHRRIVYYDSLGGTGKGVLQTLLRWLQDEAHDKLQKRFEAQAWTLTKPTALPLQTNGNDCGVFAAAYAEHVTRDASIHFRSSAIPWIRRRMCIELLCGHVPA